MVLLDSGCWVDVCLADRQELNQLRALLRVKDTNARFNSAYKRGAWDGFVSFYDHKNKRFPAGLLPIVLKKIPNVSLSSAPLKDVPVDKNWASKIKVHSPRNHQVQAVNSALKTKRGIIEVPTGGGKSLILSGICKAIQGKVLVAVHTKSLLHQTAKDIESFTGEAVGMIGDGMFNFTERITIGIIKSLEKLEQEDRDKIDALILDESHHASAKTFRKFLMSVPARYRFGLSADAFDMHRTRSSTLVKQYSVCACFGPKIHLTKNEELLSKGILAKPIITFVRVGTPDNSKNYEDMSYQDAYCALVCENKNLINSCKKLVQDAVSQKKSVLVLVKHIHQGQSISEELSKLTIDHRFLHGSTNPSILKDEMQEFKNDKYPVLIGSNIFTEGVDFPSIDVLVLAAGDVSPTKQRLGRGLRAKHGKENIVLVYDLVPVGNKYMIRHAKKRAKIYVSEGHNVTGKTSIV